MSLRLDKDVPAALRASGLGWQSRASDAAQGARIAGRCRAITPATLLRNARTLIADPDRWTTGCATRDGDGRSVMPELPEAVRFDGFGALLRLAPDAPDLRDRAAEALNAVVGPMGWSTRQDAPARTHAEVLVAMDRAVAAADNVAQLAMVRT